MKEPSRFQPVFLVLHGLRCVGVVGEDRLATATGLSREKVAELLSRLRQRGLVAHDPGPFGGWSLTSGGRVTEYELTRSELEETGARDHVHRCYQSFLRLNAGFLDVCHDWQMRPAGKTRIANSHTDPDYDAGVLARLTRLDDAVQAICADLTDRLERFGRYGLRLSFALERALAGETAYVTDNVDSYHTVWFQLHEDLLATLGISREVGRRDEAG